MNCKWFEPRSLSRLYGLIARVRVVSRRTVVGDIDRHWSTVLVGSILTRTIKPNHLLIIDNSFINHCYLYCISAIRDSTLNYSGLKLSLPTVIIIDSTHLLLFGIPGLKRLYNIPVRKRQNAFGVVVIREL